jgi:hypothetical protein
LAAARRPRLELYIRRMQEVRRFKPSSVSRRFSVAAEFLTTLDADVDLHDVQIAARHADPRTTMRQSVPARTSTATPTTSSRHTWPPAPDDLPGIC